MVVGTLVVASGINNHAYAFIPLISPTGSVDTKEVAFGGLITQIRFCECPIPGAMLTINGQNGITFSNFGGNVFYRPGSSVKIVGSGQFLRIGPFVLGTASRTPGVCGKLTHDSSICDFFSPGLTLKSIGSFP